MTQTPGIVLFLIAIFGLVVGLAIASAVAVSIGPREVAVEVETIICPPRFEAAARVDFHASYEGMPPDLTDADREFAEACGLEWGEPYFEEPPESGA